jgi:hypothetical protein
VGTAQGPGGPTIMRFANRDRERFWIALVVRIAFGFMFLVAAMNIFLSDWDEKKSIVQNASTNVTAFADGLSKPYESSWVNIKWADSKKNPETGAPESSTDVGMKMIRGFLLAMPFVLGALSIFLLTGIFLRPALRASAIFLVLLGLGKYLADFKSGSTVTTLQDFMYAMFIVLALFAISKDRVPEPSIEAR